MVDDAPRAVLQPVAHRYAAEDSERIAVDHLMRHAVPGGADGTSSSARLEEVMVFLKATVSGTIEVNHALLRQVPSV